MRAPELLRGVATADEIARASAEARRFVANLDAEALRSLVVISAHSTPPSLQTPFEYLRDASWQVTQTSYELFVQQPPPLDATTIVLIVTDDGTSHWPIGAAQYAHKNGSVVAGLVNRSSTAFQSVCRHVFRYESEASKDVTLLMMSTALLDRPGPRAALEEFDAALRAVPETLRHAISEAEFRLRMIAARLRRALYVFVISGDDLLSASVRLSNCCRRLLGVNACYLSVRGFLGGGFEIVTPEATVLFLTAGSQQQADHSAITLLRRYSQNVCVLDPGDLPMPGVSTNMQPVIGALAVRGPLTDRLTQLIR